MSEFKQLRVQGIFRPHNGDPASMFDIDPASLKITREVECLDPDSMVVSIRRTEMTIEDGKTVVHDVLDDGTRVRWTDTEDLVHSALDALSSTNGYNMDGGTAKAIVADLVKIVPALDGRDPQDLVPAVEAWLQRRKTA